MSSVKPCPLCGKPVELSAKYPNAKVYHFECTMEYTKDARYHAKQINTHPSKRDKGFNRNVH